VPAVRQRPIPRESVERPAARSERVRYRRGDHAPRAARPRRECATPPPSTYASGRKRSRRARGGDVSVRGKGDAPPDHVCVADAITLREAARRGMQSPGRRTVEIEQRRARNRAWATPVGTREAGSRTSGFLDGSGAPLRFRNRASLSRGRSKTMTDTAAEARTEPVSGSVVVGWQTVTRPGRSGATPADPRRRTSAA